MVDGSSDKYTVVVPEHRRKGQGKNRMTYQPRFITTNLAS